MFWGHRKTAHYVPCDHHVTILFVLIANVHVFLLLLRNKILFDLICCHQTSRRDTFVKEVDRFAQHGLDYYRGHVQLVRTTSTSPGAGVGVGGHHGASRQMLCELPLTLPKVRRVLFCCLEGTTCSVLLFCSSYRESSLGYPGSVRWQHF